MTQLRPVPGATSADPLFEGSGCLLAGPGDPGTPFTGAEVRPAEPAEVANRLAGHGLSARLAVGELVDAARTIIEHLGTNHFTPIELRDEAVRRPDDAARRVRLQIQNLGLDRMGIWADRDQPGIGDRIGADWRALVVDHGSLGTSRERSIIAAAVITYLWERRRERKPLLLVANEANNVCLQIPSEPNQALATEEMITMAGVGGKYGIYLTLATQRPGNIHENVLSQCDNLLLMRVNSAADLAHLATAFSPVPTALIETSAGFGLGEGLDSARSPPSRCASARDAGCPPKAEPTLPPTGRNVATRAPDGESTGHRGPGSDRSVSNTPIQVMPPATLLGE